MWLEGGGVGVGLEGLAFATGIFRKLLSRVINPAVQVILFLSYFARFVSSL